MMTDQEIELEKAYRIEERLGIMCGEATPTPDQLKLAHEEAELWEVDYRLSQIGVAQ